VNAIHHPQPPHGQAFLWLLRIAPEYAEAAITAYAKDPNSPNPWIREDIKAEKARRAQDLTAAMDAKQKASQQKPILSNSR